MADSYPRRRTREPIMPCCNTEHPWDRYDVVGTWFPRRLRYLIIGENPGAVTSQYFYDPPVRYDQDKVRVRRGLLRGLHAQGLISSPTLEGFQDGGFLFDHAIRCPLPKKTMDEERDDARANRCWRVADPAHLRPWIAAARGIWVMGHFASNAVTNATTAFPRTDQRLISQAPFPGPIPEAPQFFLSEYIHRFSEPRAPEFCAAFRRYVEGLGHEDVPA